MCLARFLRATVLLLLFLLLLLHVVDHAVELAFLLMSRPMRLLAGLGATKEPKCQEGSSDIQDAFKTRSPICRSFAPRAALLPTVVAVGSPAEHILFDLVK